MENENIIDAGAAYQGSQLTVTPLASGYLNEAGKWGKFLAIVGFCMVGFIVCIGLFAGTIFSSLGSDMPYPGIFISIIYIGIGLLYFFPVLYLFRFARQIRAALSSRDPQEMESAFENLKSHYKFIGIMMIVILSLYVLLGGGALLTTAFI